MPMWVQPGRIKRMLLNGFVLLMLFSASGSVFSQTLLDSLRGVWSGNLHSDSLRLDALNQYIWKGFIFQHPDSAIKLSEVQLELATRSGLKTAQALAWSNRGVASNLMGENKQSLEAHLEALAILEQIGDQELLARTLNHIGIVHKARGQYTLALENYQRALGIFENLTNEKGKAVILNSMGVLFMEQAYRIENLPQREQAYTKALDFFRKSLNIKQELGDKRGSINSMNNIAIIYYETEQYEESLQVHQECLELAKEVNDPLSESSSLNNIGVIYQRFAQINSDIHQKDSLLNIADSLLLEGLNIREMSGNTSLISGSLVNLSSLKRDFALLASEKKKTQLLKESRELAKRAYELASEEGSRSDLRNAAEEFWLVNKALGDFEAALIAHERFVMIKDSINSESVREDMLRQELSFDYERKTLEQKMEYETTLITKETQQRNLMAGGAVLILSLLFLAARFRLKNKLAKQLAAKNEQVEQARIRAEKSEAAKQVFLANMSHEIRTPMNAIAGLSRRLLERNHDATTLEFLNAINQSSDKLMVVLNDILDESKITSGKLEIVREATDLHAEIHSVLRSFSTKAAEKGLKLGLSTGPGLPRYVWIDSTRLSQILNNLLSNAIKFTHSGSVSFEAHSDERELIFSIRDTGPGIPTDKVEFVFESFNQLNEGSTQTNGGTGLGLTISRQLAELMGGSLSVECESGRGSVFTLRIPRKDAVETDLISRVGLSTSGRSFHLLVAEDDDYNYLVTSSTLMRYFPNAKPERARNGNELMEILNEDDYDLILMDIQMPELDGFQACRMLRAQGIQTPVLGLSASVLSTDVQRCLDAGMNGFIPKPFSDREFVEKLNAVFSGELSQTSPVTSSQIDEKELFIRYMPERLDKLSNAIASGDIKKIKFIIHALRPQLTMNGLNELERICAGIEQLSEDSTVMESAKRVLERIDKKLLEWRS